MDEKKKKIRLFPYILLVMAIILIGYVLYHSNRPHDKLPIIKTAPDFTLTDVNGSLINTTSLYGHIRLMEFIFTNCPDICPTTTYNMVQIQNELKTKNLFGDKVEMVAVTFDPVRDTPDVLKQYANRMKMDMSGWILLRGTEQETQQIMKKYGLTVQDLGDGQFVHTISSLLLVDGNQKIRKVYKMGEEMDNTQIINDIEKLVAENS